MRAFVTYDELRKFGKEIDSQRIFKEASEIQNKNIFLSHSSKDHELIPGVLCLLKAHGGRVYIDENDPTLPTSNFLATANHLRTAVRSCRKFILFVTPNTKDSSWIPWELGIGDGTNLESNVALFPSAEKYYEQSWSEIEYLGLYQRIIWGNFEGQKSEWLVINHHTKIGLNLGTWIAN